MLLPFLPLLAPQILLNNFLTELVIALAVRTGGVFFRSRPGTVLLVSTPIVVGITLVLRPFRVSA